MWGGAWPGPGQRVSGGGVSWTKPVFNQQTSMSMVLRKAAWEHEFWVKVMRIWEPSTPSLQLLYKSKVTPKRKGPCMLCRGWAGEQLWVERPGSPSRVAGPATGQQRSQGVTMDTTVLIWVLGGVTCTSVKRDRHVEQRSTTAGAELRPREVGSRPPAPNGRRHSLRRML